MTDAVICHVDERPFLERLFAGQALIIPLMTPRIDTDLARILYTDAAAVEIRYGNVGYKEWHAAVILPRLG